MRVILLPLKEYRRTWNDELRPYCRVVPRASNMRGRTLHTGNRADQLLGLIAARNEFGRRCTKLDATFTLLPPLFWKVGNLDIVNAADPAFVMDMTTIVSSAVKDGRPSSSEPKIRIKVP